MVETPTPRARCAVTQEPDGKTPHRRHAIALCVVNTGGDDVWRPAKLPVCADHMDDAHEQVRILDRAGFKAWREAERCEINAERAKRGLPPL